MKERSQEFLIYQNESEFIKSSWHLEASTMLPLCFSLLLAPGHGAVRDRFHPRPLVLRGNQSCAIQNFWVSEACPSSKLQTHSLPFRAFGLEAKAELSSYPRKMNKPCKDAFSSPWLSIELEDSDFSLEQGRCGWPWAEMRLRNNGTIVGAAPGGSRVWLYRGGSVAGGLFVL